LACTLLIFVGSLSSIKSKIMQKSILVFAIVFLFSISAQAQSKFSNYKKEWHKVEQFELKNLPKSALAAVEKIYIKAQKEKNSPQLVKTLLYKSKFALTLEEDAQLKVVNSLKEAIEKEVIPTKNILESILADLYWQYFQQNRWRFYNRTKTTAKVDTTDFRTWDLQTIFEETHTHYQKSLASALLLKEIDLRAFKEILNTQKDSHIFRPSLYDFLAHRAIQFYQNDERNLKRPAYKFEITKPKLLGSNAVFIATETNSKDSLSQQLQALKIYKNLTFHHLKNNNFPALVTLTLDRLNFVRNNAVFQDKDVVYLHTLKELKVQYKKYEISTEIDFRIASLLNEQADSYQPNGNDKNRWNRKEALKICTEGIAKFPKSKGIEKLKGLQSQILVQQLSLTAEQMIPIAKPSRILISYKNADKLFFNAFQVTKRQQQKFHKIYKNSLRIAFINTLKIAKTWEVSLKNEQDYQQHTTEVKMPALEQGAYLIFASTKKEYTFENTYAMCFIQVTDLSLIESEGSGKYKYQVVNRNTGKPIVGATVHVKNYNTGRYNKKINKIVVTDVNGQVSFAVKQSHSNVIVTVSYQKDKAVFGDFYLNENYRHDNDDNDNVDAQAFLFTDRSIYRPGQILYFKGIVVERFHEKSKLISNEGVTITLHDVNGQEVKNLDLKTNEFGSFSGEFILPSSGLMGQYYLEVDGDISNIYGTHYFSVEEYKRPKFETEFKSLTESYKVNDSVTVHGTATAYAGSNITDAKVVYRVVRTAQYPKWYWYSRSSVSSDELEIVHGESITDASGKFEITFKAIPDLKVSKDSQPIFKYQIFADITDINGETRSAKTTVRIGYHALEARVNIADRVDKDRKDTKLTLSTNNLNGEFVATKGYLKVYKLISPKITLRKRPWQAPDYQEIPKDEFQKLYPHEAYGNENDAKHWEKGDLVFTSNFDTEKTKEITLGKIKKWISGQYIITLTCKDKFGQDVKDETRFTVFGCDKIVSDKQLFIVKTDKENYKPKDKVVLTLGSASEDMTVTVEVEKNHQIIKTQLLHLSNEIKKISIPVTENDRGGFAIHYRWVNYNEFGSGTQNISVPYPTKELDIETTTFRDKLQPGQDETWSFKLKGSKSGQVAAELLASMYDASLDQFQAHEWGFNPIYHNYYYSYSRSSANHSFGNVSFNVHQENHSYYGYSYQGFDQLNWFGFSLVNSWLNRTYLSQIKQKNANISYYDKNKEKGYVYGVVLAEGDVLPGVSIVVKGTTNGTETDFDGNYKIAIKKGDVLVFSFVGYETVEVKVDKKNIYNIDLEADTAALDEVVVVGYGSDKREKKLRAVVGAVENDAVPMMEISGKAAGVRIEQDAVNKPKPKGASQEKPSLKGIVARKNLQETAFFFPHLRTDKEGNVSFNFTAPESLTRWKLQLLAHTKDLATTTKQLTAVTQKELMVLPNPPRFLREGDQITIASKIANLTDKPLTGISELQLFDALTNKSIDTELGNTENSVEFIVKAKGNANVSWTLQIPNGVQAVKYKILAKAGNFTDGEENALPVLSNRILVTETLPMWLRSNQTKTFTLDKLRDNSSTTLTNHKLSLEITSNPAWYAVQALPYLMEYPFECAEQTFSRYYANALAGHIANSNPRIQEVFKQWASSDALLSNLEKNQELKSIIIEETPWLRDAQSETEQKKRIALLFDLNKMKNELESAARKLRQMQMANGGFPWFQGAHYPNRYITQHIASGFGHLKKLGVGVSARGVIQSVSEESQTKRMLSKAVNFLDDEILNDYKEILKQVSIIRKRAKTKEEGLKLERKYLAQNHTGNFQIQYLYMRSFYPEQKIPKRVQKAVDYYTKQAYRYWLDRNLYTKGMIALIAHRNENKAVTGKIMASLKENSITSDELGMYWKTNTASWYWYQAPIETQALLIEAFTEVGTVVQDDAKNLKDIDNLKIWLLKNKQTNRWKTTKATTEAVYALLLQGTDWLEVTDFIGITIGNQKIDPLQLETSKVEAGTGYFKTSWLGAEITPAMATVQLTKKSNGIAWGALYWQYFEDLDKITSAKTPLQLSKKLFLKKNTDKGEELSEITENTHLKLGDLVKVRIELKVDRVMEFVHMKDMRAAGFEPINVLSRYKYQDGLGYYESTKDAATHFFFDRLPKGVYVFEYSLRVNNKGDFSNGISTIQSMYAPEFSSHSEGVRVKIE